MKADERIARQVGATVRHLRSQRGQAQRQVARLAGIPRAALSAYERGQQLPSEMERAIRVPTRNIASIEKSWQRLWRRRTPNLFPTYAWSVFWLRQSPARALVLLLGITVTYSKFSAGLYFDAERLMTNNERPERKDKGRLDAPERTGSGGKDFAR